MAQVYGYARVSARDQNEERQLLSLARAGVQREKIFVDQKSGRDFDRPQYQRLLRQLKPRDLLMVPSIDRLGRNYGEIQTQWQHITKDCGADIVVLDMPLLDTRVGKDLLGTFISDVVLQVLSFAAQHERESIHARQAEGIAAARQRGVPMGRPRIPLPENFTDIFLQWKEGEIPLNQAAKHCGVSRSTFCRWAAEWEGELKR